MQSTHPFWIILGLFLRLQAFVVDEALAGALHLGLGGGPV